MGSPLPYDVRLPCTKRMEIGLRTKWQSQATGSRRAQRAFSGCRLHAQYVSGEVNLVTLGARHDEHRRQMQGAKVGPDEA